VRFANGDIERYPIELYGGYVTNGEYAMSLNHAPSHSISPTDRCGWAADMFGAEIDQGKARAGSVVPDEEYDESFEPFDWKIVGSEADLCRERMAYWLERLGEDSVFSKPYDGDLPDFDRRRLYDDNLSYWTWMKDPEAELAALVAERTSTPAP